MKKLFVFLCLSILTIFILVPVNADMFPKPTSEIEIIGLDEPYSFDLLKHYNPGYVKRMTGDEVEEQLEYSYYKEDYPEELNGYYDNDGYASYTLYTSRPRVIKQLEPNLYHCGYVSPPDVFKIVLVLESGQIIVSDIIHKSLFNASFTFDLSGFSIDQHESQVINGQIVYTVENMVNEKIPYNHIVLQILIAMLATLIVEVIILLAFQYKKSQSYKVIVLGNSITQTLLHGSVILAYWYGNIVGLVGTLIIGELIVFTIEIILYRRYLKEKTKSMATIYAVTANMVSFVLGWVALTWLIGLFT